ncbi:hypothetical protein [Nocardia amamiensis]|uniref:Uncharacterized protein n=1 Tax=Nocardia amamiensis TaxID=404578 RepID=A0ABS0CNQ8_9NOCA|nr:hypothetical protein [Nocardia amamiensis]MBF6297830.1 hypothetical protein [Nocardia amamiensis]
MKIRFLGKNTNKNGCPTLYITDRGTYVVQGWRVAGPPNMIEIPHPLLAFLEPGTCLGVLLQDTGHGTFLLSGEAVTDPETLSKMDIPDHETCVEVLVGQEIRPDATVAR